MVNEVKRNFGERTPRPESNRFPVMEQRPRRQIDPRSVPAIAARLRLLREVYAVEDGFQSASDRGAQIAFCERVGINPPTWNNWEKGRHPGLEYMIRVRDKTGATLDWIYLGDMAGLPFKLSSRLQASPLVKL